MEWNGSDVPAEAARRHPESAVGRSIVSRMGDVLADAGTCPDEYCFVLRQARATLSPAWIRFGYEAAALGSFDAIARSVRSRSWSVDWSRDRADREAYVDRILASFASLRGNSPDQRPAPELALVLAYILRTLYFPRSRP